MYSNSPQIEVGATNRKEQLEPLLSKSDVSDESWAEKSDNQTQLSPSTYYAAFGYVQGQRPYHDIPSTIIFFSVVLASATWGIFCIANHNKDYSLVDSALYNSSSGLCYSYDGYSGGSAIIKEPNDLKFMGIWHKGHGTNRKSDFLKGIFPGWAQIYSEKRLEGSFSTDSLVEVLLLTLVLTVALSIPFIFGFLWLLKTFARQLVFSCLPFFILVPAFLDVFWFVACLLSSECQESFSLTGQISLFIFIAILCGIFALIIYSNRDHIEITIRMMQASAQALFSNWMLLIVLPGLSLVFFAYLGPFVVFLIYGYMNGEIVGTPGTYCQGESATDCCTWSVGKWVPLYYIVTIFTVLWSILLMTQVQVYIISSTIAQWYFAMSKTKVTGRIWCSFKNVFGPSFGTVTFSGLIVSFVSMIRALLDSTRSVDDQQGFFATMLQRFVRFALVSIEFLNRFTISFAAITGESYCHSARLSYELLKRNLLSPILLEVISTQLLTGMAFILTVVYAIVVLIVLKAGMSLGSVAYYVTALAWLLLFVMFLLFCQVLNNTIDTLYICYAIDKDSGNFPTMEVLDIYTMLPVSRDQSRALVAQQV